MVGLTRQVYCASANTLIAIAIVIFAIGFFPHKALLPGLATWPTGQMDSRVPSPFDRVIFMVVDALRSDFVYGNASSFKFTQSLIRSGAAVPFTGHASPPTITMPRVKAITTGSVPSFLDLVLNFAESDTSATLAAQDTWLAQMRAQPNGKLVMYGDDTWLRLFPDFFDRSDGTTSFFVSDFTEVDNNVTRHVPEELTRDDWRVMVLHFLGLDHIGHKTGPRGPNMPGKQREMDSIVETIFKSMESQSHLQSSLLVLLGDHGMNEAGNHGASSAGEVSTALTFISPKFQRAFEGVMSPAEWVEDFQYYENIEQSDVVPTLAALLGFPVPRNNLGTIIPTLLDLWTADQDKLHLLFENAQQMHAVAAATFPAAFAAHTSESSCQSGLSSDDESLACAWLRAERAYASGNAESSNTKAAMKATREFLLQAQGTLSGTASNYDLWKMYCGIGLASLATVAAIMGSIHTFSVLSFPGFAFLAIMLLYGVTMFASSYIEEEQQFWFWALGGWLVLLLLKASRFPLSLSSTRRLAVAGAGLLFGFVRRWNQTGQKFAGGPDFVTQLLSKQQLLLWALVLLTYAVTARSLTIRAAYWGSSQQLTLLPAIACFVAFAFKVTFTAEDAPELLSQVPFGWLLAVTTRYPLVNLARVVFLGIAHLFGCALFYSPPWKGHALREEFLLASHDLLTLFLITQSRTVNVPVFLLFAAQLHLLSHSSYRLKGTELTVTSLLLQYASFFALGGTNAISSVDLSNAYNGVSGYNAGMVGILTFVGNWAGPIWWASATCRILGSRSMRRKEYGAAFSHFARLTLFATTSTLFVMLACLVLREHLFIWTVFSPKYLYSVAWIFGHHVVVNGLFGLLIFGG